MSKGKDLELQYDKNNPKHVRFYKKTATKTLGSETFRKECDEKFESFASADAKQRSELIKSLLNGFNNSGLKFFDNDGNHMPLSDKKNEAAVRHRVSSRINKKVRNDLISSDSAEQRYSKNPRNRQERVKEVGSQGADSKHGVAKKARTENNSTIPDDETDQKLQLIKQAVKSYQAIILKRERASATDERHNGVSKPKSQSRSKKDIFTRSTQEEHSR